MGLSKEEVKVGTVFEHRTGYIGVVTGPFDGGDGTYRVKPLTTGGSDYVHVGEKRWVRPEAIAYVIHQPEEVKAAATKPEEKVELELGGVKVAMTYRQFEKFVSTFGKY